MDGGGVAVGGSAAATRLRSGRGAARDAVFLKIFQLNSGTQSWKRAEEVGTGQSNTAMRGVESTGRIPVNYR